MPVILAWMVGEGIIIWRWSKAKAPPTPGALLLASLLYLGAGVAAEYQPARNVAIAWAWAVNVAVLMNVLPGGADAKNGVKTGWPPPWIPCGQILPTAGTGVTAKPDCSPAAASSSAAASSAGSTAASAAGDAAKKVASGAAAAAKKALFG